ncbi:hypothetical protein [Latilactobacillus sakei]|uniref:hypothetical protein n=1 Tax=Latilactobacillus sakei TaxID=1599 RepID=UPI00241C64B1|nr:hypothetical protein [Latilactobacillus sakei]
MTKDKLITIAYVFAIVTILLSIFTFFNSTFTAVLPFLTTITIVLTVAIRHWGEPYTTKKFQPTAHIEIKFKYQLLSKMEWLLCVLCLIALILDIIDLFL